MLTKSFPLSCRWINATRLGPIRRATEEKLVRRQGAGRKNDPYRYRLPTADDEYWDRGELPPLRPLGRGDDSRT